MKQLISYHNDPKLKESFLNEIRQHMEADSFIKGKYGNRQDNEHFKGCGVGCSINSFNRMTGEEYETNNHACFEMVIGVPEWLARLEDTIFEGLDEDQSKLWPFHLSEAIPVGKNLEPVKWKYCSWLMQANIDRVKTLNLDDGLKLQVIDAIEEVKSVHDSAIKSGNWDESAAGSAGSAAWSAAWSAARSAESAAGSAAWSAARSAESAAGSAASAAWSAAWSAARSAAGSAFYEQAAAKIIELLKGL